MEHIKSTSPSLRDLREVEQFGFVDLNDAIASGKLTISVPASEQQYDAPAGTVLSPSMIGGMPSDVFEAFEMRDNLRAASQKSQQNAEASSAAAPAATE